MTSVACCIGTLQFLIHSTFVTVNKILSGAEFCYTTDTRAASFKHSLLSVDVDVCMCEAMSVSLMLNISETKEDRGLFSLMHAL